MSSEYRDYIEFGIMPGIDPDPVIYQGEDITEGCPVCGGELTYEPADPSVGIMSEVYYCENSLADGTPCPWPTSL